MVCRTKLILGDAPPVDIWNEFEERDSEACGTPLLVVVMLVVMLVEVIDVELIDVELDDVDETEVDEEEELLLDVPPHPLYDGAEP